jgi:hypothetical protein
MEVENVKIWKEADMAYLELIFIKRSLEIPQSTPVRISVRPAGISRIQVLNVTARLTCSLWTDTKDWVVTRTGRSRAEKLWLVCGVMGDVMQCDRERDIHPSQKFYATIRSEKMTPHNSFVLQTLISNNCMFSR